MANRLFLFALLQGASVHAASTHAQLPSIREDSSNRHTRASLEQSGKWWARVDDHIYHQPTSFLGLSSEISSYYCALGSEDALPEDARKYRVGGQGRWHIFHLPDGPSKSMLQHFGHTGDRRESFSALIQLTHGRTLSNTFPVYKPAKEYQNPLNANAQGKEKAAVDMVTKDTVTKYLTDLTSMPTRSYSNPKASESAEAFLQKQFAEMGIQSCLHKFNAQGTDMANVVGIIPGQKAGSVTVGAHYDSRPFTGSAPGAEDNGSGVAALLAMANAYSKAKIQPEKTIYFVGFAGEEPGLLGSEAFAEQIHKNSEGIPTECRLQSGGSFLQQANNGALHKAIILDEVGWISKNRVDFPKPTVNLEALDEADEVMQHLVHACHQYNGDELEVVHNNAPFGSDHMSFSQNGMHSVLTINGDDEKYPNYHQHTDTFTGDNVNTHYVSQIAKMDMGALVRLSGVSDQARQMHQ